MFALYLHGHQETTNGAHPIKTPRPAFVIYGAASISDDYSAEMEYKGGVL